MDEKLTLEELISKFAVKQNIVQTDADAFVCSFLALIVEGLKRDKYVRVNGLGTFKLIDADLGEGRVVFVPEASIRDAVNKPFAHFQAVELKDTVRFSDVEEEVKVASDETCSWLDKDETKEEQTLECQEKVSSVNGADDKESQGDYEKNELQHDEKVGDAKSNTHWYLFAAILLAGIIIGGGIMWGILSGGMSGVSESDDSLDGSVVDTAFEDSVRLVACSNKDSISIDAQVHDTIETNKRTIDSIISSTTEDKDEIDYLSDQVVYKITGTIEKYTIKKGSTLSKVAYRYYKNKKLWPYIVMHNKNVIVDPNNVPIGTELSIPVLTPVD